MVAFKNNKKFAVHCLDFISKLEILMDTNRQLEAENVLLKAENFVLKVEIAILEAEICVHKAGNPLIGQKLMQELTKSRVYFEEVEKIFVLLKGVLENGLGDIQKLNDLIAELEKLLSAYSTWLDDNEEQE